MSRMVIFRNIDDPRPPLTRERVIIGVQWGQASWVGRFAKVNAEVGSLDLAVNSTLAKWKDAPPEEKVRLAFKAWLSEFAAFKFDWNRFQGEYTDSWLSGWTGVWATDANSALMQTFEKRIFVLREQYDKLTAVVVPPTPPTPPYVVPENTVSKTASSLAELAKWAAIGVIGFMALRVVTDVLPRKSPAT